MTNNERYTLKNSELKKHIRHLERRITQLEKIVNQSVIWLPIILNTRNVPDHISIIQKIVANVCHVKVQDITKVDTRGKSELSDARTLGMTFCLEHELATTENIASRFGKKNHSTVSKAKIRCSKLRTTDVHFREKYDACKTQIATALKADVSVASN